MTGTEGDEVEQADLDGSSAPPDPRFTDTGDAGPDRRLLFRRVKSQLFGSPPANEPVRIGRFVVIKRIGQGGMGLIYAAYDDSLDRKVAVKLLRPERAGVGSEGQARLMREAQALARLSHPNVVVVYEVGTYEDQVYVAMEYVEGETLEAWQANRDWHDILALYMQAGRGLAAAHAAGIVHRDFKAENVLVGKDERSARVLDFGLARTEFEPGDAEVEALRHLVEEEVDIPLTHTGVIMGTPAYMAPEQHAGQATDPRTDQFSFCVALWEALYGFRPFAGNTLAELRFNVQDGAVEPAPRFTDVPPRVHRALLRGLSTAPGARFPTMDALLDELAEPAQKNRMPLVAAAGVLLAMVTAGLMSWSAAEDKEVASEGLRLRAEFERARVVEAEEELRRLRSRTVSEKWNEVVLSYAQENVGEYPTESLAALKHLVVEADGWHHAARTVAADAARRGPIAREIRGVGEVQELRFDPAGRVVAILTDGGRIVRWEIDTGAYEAIPIPDPAEPHESPARRRTQNAAPVFTHLAFDPTGRLLATDSKGELYRWSSEDTVDIAYLGELSVTALTAAPNGNIALGDIDGTIRVVDRSSFEFEHILRNHDQVVRSLDFSPDGERLASASDDGTVKLWALEPGTHRTLPASPSALHCRFLDEGRLVAGVTSSNELHVWATSDGRRIPNRSASARTFDAAPQRSLLVLDHPEVGLSVRYPEDVTPRPLDHHGGSPTAIAVAPTGRWATAATDGAVLAWRIGEDERGMRPGGEIPFLTTDGNDGSIRAMAFAPSGELVWGSGFGVVRRWNPDGSSSKLLDLDGRIQDIAIDPSGTRVAVDDEEGFVRLVELEGGETTPLVLEEPPLAGRLHWSPDGSTVAKLGCAGGVTCFIDLFPTDGTPGTRLPVSAGSRALRFSPDGGMLVVEGDDGVTLWPGEEDAVPVSWPVEPAPQYRVALAHTGDGSLRIATTDRNPAQATTIRLDVWQAGARPDRLHALFSEPDLSMVVASEDRRSLLLRTAEGRNLLWRLEEDRFRMLPDEIGPISRMLVSPDGRSLLLVGPDNTEAHVLDIESGHMRALPPVFGLVAWSTDGRIAIAGRGTRQWLDPTPADPAEFEDWLEAATTVELEPESIRSKNVQR